MSTALLAMSVPQCGVAASLPNEGFAGMSNIDVAFVSGRLGTAFFRVQDSWFELAAYRGEPFPVAIFRLQELLCQGSEYSIIRNTTLEDVKSRLSTESELST